MQNKLAEIELTENELVYHLTQHAVKCKQTELSLCGISPELNHRILDAGCGTGTFSILLAESGNCVIGIDISAKALSIARQRAEEENVTFLPIVADLECLPFGNNLFDVIFCANILHHFRDISSVINQLANTLKPGGTFTIIEHNGSNLLVRVSRIATRVLRRIWPLLADKSTGNIEVHTHTEYYSHLDKHMITDISCMSLYHGRPPNEDLLIDKYALHSRCLWHFLNTLYCTGTFIFNKVLPQPYCGNILILTGVKHSS